MDSTVDRYEVTKGCYVPVGTGVKFKPAGSIVTLDSVDAEELKGYVKKASKAKLKGRSKLNTPVRRGPSDEAFANGTDTADDQSDTRPDPAVISTEAVNMVSQPPGEVTSDAGESSPVDERAGDEAQQ